MERDRNAVPTDRAPVDGVSGQTWLKKPFVIPKLTGYEPIQRITLVSNAGFPGSGGTGGTFFGA